MAVNFNIEDFKLTMVEFKGLAARTSANIIRHVTRFLGGYSFPDEADTDLGHLLISIFRSGLIRPLLKNKLWHCKQNYLTSLKSSLNHFAQYIENEAMVFRAFGGLTTALGPLARALDYEMAAPTRSKEQQRQIAKAVKLVKLVDDWVGADIYTEFVTKAHQGLRYIWEHAADAGFWDKWVHSLANQFIAIIIYLNLYPGRAWG